MKARAKRYLSGPMTLKTTIGEREKGRAMQKLIRQLSGHSSAVCHRQVSPVTDTQRSPDWSCTATAIRPLADWRPTKFQRSIADIA
jgi:alkyl hydroperoxide reductase subunit AhpF